MTAPRKKTSRKLKVNKVLPQQKWTWGKFFASFSEKASDAAGSPVAFILALTTLLIWAGTGPFFDYSEVWQIVINTLTTIITFLLVFLIQNSQNRETRALQLKLDELIRSSKGAHNALLGVEKLSDTELKAFCQLYKNLADKARQQLAQGMDESGTPALAIETTSTKK